MVRGGAFALMMVLFIISFVPQQASAQEEAESGWRFGVVPRVWFSTIDIPDDDVSSSEAAFVPLVGGTVYVSPSFAPNLSLLATGFTGEGESDVVKRPLPGSPAVVPGTADVKRTDIEVLVRYNFPRNWFLGIGGRFVRIDVDATVAGSSSNTDVKIWLGEIATGLLTDITEDGRHRLFGNFTFLAGTFESEFTEPGLRLTSSDVQIGTDLNLGYEYWLASFANIGARYRITTLGFTNDFDLTKIIVIQGPEVSVGFVF